MAEFDATQIAKIVREEIEKYLGQHPVSDAKPIKNTRNVLVVFTGSDVGLPIAIEQLQRLKQKPYSLTFLLSIVKNSSKI